MLTFLCQQPLHAVCTEDDSTKNDGVSAVRDSTAVDDEDVTEDDEGGVENSSSFLVALHMRCAIMVYYRENNLTLWFLLPALIL